MLTQLLQFSSGLLLQL